MKALLGSFASTLLLLSGVWGQAPVIESFSSNGELVCANLAAGTVAVVEWAPSVNGPWTNTWAGLDAVGVDANGTIRVKVPMFYRVRGETKPTPPGMVLIPAGSFTMGDTIGDGDSHERPAHTVSVSAFYMDKYLVTKALWDEVYTWAVAHGYNFNNPGSGKAANHPVQTVDWYDVVKWCNAPAAMNNKTPPRSSAPPWP